MLIMISYYAMGFVTEAFTSTVFNHLCGKKIVITSSLPTFFLAVLAGLY